MKVDYLFSKLYFGLVKSNIRFSLNGVIIRFNGFTIDCGEAYLYKSEGANLTKKHFDEIKVTKRKLIIWNKGEKTVYSLK